MVLDFGGEQSRMTHALPGGVRTLGEVRVLKADCLIHTPSWPLQSHLLPTLLRGPALDSLLLVLKMQAEPSITGSWPSDVSEA